MTIYLIRHGETPDNQRRVLQMPDSPLSQTGTQQAQKLAQRLATLSISAIISSDYLRARQTAEALNHYHQLPPIQDPLLRERDFGDWRGRRYEDVANDRLNTDLDPPNGEDTQVFKQRIANSWQALQRYHAEFGGILLVVSHGLTCRALLQNHPKVAPNLVLPGSLNNTSVSIIEPTPEWTITKVNCTEHLT